MFCIVDVLNYHEVCEDISCDYCSFYDANNWHCRLKEWLEKQPRFEDKERLIPVTTITFDEEKLKELCDKAVSDLIIKCPNCGKEIKPKGGEES